MIVEQWIVLAVALAWLTVLFGIANAITQGLPPAVQRWLDKLIGGDGS